MLYTVFKITEFVGEYEMQLRAVLSYILVQLFVY